MTRDEILAKLDKIVSKDPGKWLDNPLYKDENEKWLSRSQAVAFTILTELDNQGLSQKALADRMRISAQQVNKWVKGSENFTFETIAKLEEALGIELMNVVGEDWNMAKKKKVVEKKVVVPNNPEYNTITTAIKDSILAGEPEVHLKKNKKTK
jgi:transcriptional regulator with XRE-family HTH domain